MLLTRFKYGFIFLVMQVKATRFCDYLSNDITSQCYLKDTLATVAHSPNQLVVAKDTNTLFFSLDLGQGEYVPASLRIGSKQIKVLRGVKDAFALANDNETGEVYFGGGRGIYKYDPRKKQLKRLSVKDLDVWWLVFKKGLYFVKFPSLFTYMYQNRTVKPMESLTNISIYQFVFDRHDNIFFINSTGLFGIRHGGYEAILLRDNPRFAAMGVDNENEVYVCSEDGIFVVNKMAQKIKRVVNAKGVLGMTFDKNNNIVYSDSHEIVRLVPV